MRKDRISTSIDLILLILFTVSAIFLFIQIYLGNFISFFWQSLIVMTLIASVIGFFIWIFLTRKLAWLRRCIMILSTVILIFGANNLSNKRSIMIKEYEKIMTYYQMNLVTADENIQQSKDLVNQKIGVLKNDHNNFQSFEDINQAFQTNNCGIIEFYNLDYLIKALNRNEIHGMILSDFNLMILKNRYPEISEKLTVLSQNVHEIEISHTAQPKEDQQPLKILLTLSGENKPLNYVSYSSKCFLLFIDPLSQKITFIEIPNNLYIPNVAYDSYPDALYNVSYNGIDNLLYSLESIFGFEFDYFIKTNEKSILNYVDILQGINLTHEVCEEEVCSMISENMNLEQVSEFYEKSRDMNVIIEGIFEKRSSLKATKLINVLNSFQRNSFTNLSTSSLSRIINQVNMNENWTFERQQIDYLDVFYEPCVSMGALGTYEVAIMDENFLDLVYGYNVDLAHMEIMNNFKFDLDRMRNQLLLPYSNEKIILKSNMGWKIDEYFAFLPESTVNPIEVEKWKGTIHFDRPNFDPDAPIHSIQTDQ